MNAEGHSRLGVCGTLSSLVIDTSGISRAASVARARDLAQTYKRKGFFAWIYK